MELIKRHVCGIAAALLIVCVAGCQNGPKRDVVTKTVTTSHHPNFTTLHTQELKEINVAMSNLGYNGDQLAASMHSSSMNAAMQPGASPGAGLAGALIGGSIIKSSAQNAAQKQKNEPVADFLTTLENLNWQDIFSSSELGAQYSFISPKDKTKNNETLLILTPSAQVSADYRSIRLTVTAAVTKKGKVIYKNFFHLQSQPLLTGEDLLSSVNTISVDEATAGVQQLIDKLPYLIKQDMQSWPGKELQRSVAIKFKNASGEYFERGYLLEQKQNEIIFKSLRGEVKRYPANEVL